MTRTKAAIIAQNSIVLMALCLAAFWSMSSALDDMSRHDCHAGVKAACKSIR